MKPTVSLETAKKLAEAGFLPPDKTFGQIWYTEDVFVRTCIFLGRHAEHPADRFLEKFSGAVLVVFKNNKATFAPTATDILSQFTGILSRGIDGQWQCRFTITQYNDDCYYDQCPHEAAAKAFLAWKAGLS